MYRTVKYLNRYIPKIKLDWPLKFSIENGLDFPIQTHSKPLEVTIAWILSPSSDQKCSNQLWAEHLSQVNRLQCDIWPVDIWSCDHGPKFVRLCVCVTVAPSADTQMEFSFFLRRYLQSLPDISLDGVWSQFELLEGKHKLENQMWI